MVSKEIKIYLVLFSTFVSCLIAQQIFFYGSQNNQTEYVTIDYYDKNNPISINYEYPIIISKPVNVINEKNPAIILIHGDHVDYRSMNSVKLEFLQNNYYVISVTIDFTLKSFFELNATLNYLLTRPDINSSQIGVLGHSHGAHYAFLFAWMRNDSIGCYVGTNPGAFGHIYQDYFEFFNNFEDLNDTYDYLTYLSSYTIEILDTKPKNMLILTNIYNPQRKSQYYPFTGNLTLWEFNKTNEIIGNFDNGTARKLLIEPSIFLHSSGVYDPQALKEQIDWVNQSLGVDAEAYVYWHVVLRISFYFLLVVAITLSGLLIFGKILSTIPLQTDKLSQKFIQFKSNNKSFQFNGTKLNIPEGTISDIDQRKSKKLSNTWAKILNYSLDEEFDSYRIIKRTIGIFVSLIIGGNIFIYILFFVKAEELIYLNLPVQIENAIENLYVINDQIGNIIYFGPLSFGIVYIWFILVFFNQQVIRDEFQLIKTNKEITFVRFFFNILSLMGILLVLWLFGILTLYLWSGFNLEKSFLNYFLRFASIFYFNYIVAKLYRNQTGTKNYLIYLKLMGMSILLYFPLMTIPNLHSMYYYFEYYWFYYIPFIFQIFVLPIFIMKKMNLYILSFINFYVIMLWQVSVFF